MIPIIATSLLVLPVEHLIIIIKRLASGLKSKRNGCAIYYKICIQVILMLKMIKVVCAREVNNKNITLSKGDATIARRICQHLHRDAHEGKDKGN